MIDIRLAQFNCGIWLAYLINDNGTIKGSLGLTASSAERRLLRQLDKLEGK